MKIVADNYADSLRRPGADSSDAAFALDIVAADLRTHHRDTVAAVPEALLALARRLDTARETATSAA